MVAQGRPGDNRRSFLKTTAVAGFGTLAGAAGRNAVSPSLWKEQLVFDSNHSHWSRVLSEPGSPLQKDLQADVAIIGGGFTGLSAAY
jgi:hypothetical protein